MTRFQRFLTACGIITAVEVALWLVVRSGQLTWQEWHRVGGSHWLSILVLGGSVSTVIVLVWLLILLVRS